MIKVDGKELVLDGSDDTLLKELSYLICSIRLRMMTRGCYAKDDIDKKIEAAQKDTDTWKRDELRTNAWIAAEPEQIRRRRQ